MISLNAPKLSAEQRAKLDRLARELTAEQLIWASGYFAGLAGQGATPPAPVAAAGTAAPSVTVLFGTETGNARALAGRIGQALAQRGVGCQVIGMDEYKPRLLKSEQHLLVVTATHGEGDPPEPSRGFHEFLMGRKAPKLDGVRFAVLGLGDSSYEFFCQTAKNIDARLAELGAERVHPRADCDVDFEAPAAAWIGEVTALFAKLASRTAPPLVVLPGGLAEPPPEETAKPVPAVVLDRIRLNGRGSDKATYHIEFDLGGAPLRYLPGDSLGIRIENDPALVQELVDGLGLGADEDLAQALRTEFELTVLTPAFIEAYARAGGIEPLLALHADSDRKALRRYMENRQIVDVVREYPVSGLSAATLKGLLRKLQPRLYSIASSAVACPGEVHIAVAEVQYRSPFAERLGVASGALCRRIEPGATLDVHVERNAQFRLPEDPQTPIILIGAGTGVAPYRAFLQEREAQGVRGRAWLVFGERRFRTDFLYQTEWQQHLREGVLTRMDVAFSRDQGRKIYVQDRLRERGREIYAWIEEGAHIYVCGDASRMAPDVHAALIDVIATHGGRDPEAAREYLNDLTIERRYKRDVY